MNFSRKKKLHIGTIDELFEETYRKLQSIASINEFKSGEDDDIFNQTINSLNESVISSIESIEQFKNGEDDEEFQNILNTLDGKSNNAIEKFKNGNDELEFTNLLEKKVKKCYVVNEVRERCKMQAKKFKYNEELFSRFPMWVFRCFAASDPMCRNYNETKKIELMTIFMLLNRISPDLMMAFYIEGGQSVNDSMKIRNIFNKMRDIYNKNEKEDLIALFGTQFTFHCQSKTLRRIDMSKVEYNTADQKNEPFIPDNMEWRRQRVVRNLIRNGCFTVNDELDIQEVKRAWQNGLRLRGRFINKN